MRKTVAALLVALSLLAVPANADVGSAVVILNAVAATGASATYNVSKASFIRVQVYSAIGSTATVLLQERACPGIAACSAPWFTVTTVTDPGVAGEYWSVPVTMQFQANVSAYTGGNITVILETHSITP